MFCFLSEESGDIDILSSNVFPRLSAVDIVRPCLRRVSLHLRHQSDRENLIARVAACGPQARSSTALLRSDCPDSGGGIDDPLDKK